jgi:beta-galactosidase
MLFGVSYYHEYQPYERLADDVRMMTAAHIDYARVGDSIWSLCEPVEGEFDIDWLQRILDALHGGGIQVILVTPTYAIPPWFARRHPEAMAVGADGSSTPFGGRQNMDITNPTYRFYAERVTRKLLERYAGHPAVIGFQVDNETGTGMLHNDAVFDRFVEHLRAKFETVDAVNEIWGLTYWSHRLGSWSDLWRPAGNTNPGYDLEWRRFQTGLTREFIAWQVGIVREYATGWQFVTQDLVGGHGRGDANRYQIAAEIDVVAENFPHATQDALAHPPVPSTIYPAKFQGTGPAQIYQRGDLAYGAGRSNFLVTEMNPISIGGSDNTFPGFDGQWRMAAYASISRGADMVAYWHWHSLHYGRETYSHGILNHDLEPNRCYDELARIGAELARHGDLLTGLTPEAEVALLYSYDSRYALEFQPCLKDPDGSMDVRSYRRVFDRFYRSFFDARAQSIVLPAGAEIHGYPVVVAPALYVADEQTLQGLAEYAEAGGHLVLSFRTGYADEYARARWQRAPGPLRKAAGASYRLYSNLADPLRVRAADAGGGTEHGLDLRPGAGAEAWMDELELEGAEPLAYYEHPHFGRYPAAVTQAYGAGRVTYVGTLPNPVFGQDLARWVLQVSGVEVRGDGLPDPVRVTGARTTDGQRLAFVANWSFDPVTVDAGISGRDLVDDVRIDGSVALGAWDMKIVIEDGLPG